MNYRQTINQTWQVIKNTKPLWLFGLISLLSSVINDWEPDSLALRCLNFSIIWLIIVLSGFSDFGIITCTDKAIRGESPKFNEIRLEFNKIFGRAALLYILLLIFFGLVILSFYLAASVLSFNESIARVPTTQIWILIYIFSPVIIGISRFSFFGLFLGRMSVIQSLKHGLSLFAMYFHHYIFIHFCFQIPFIASLLILGSLQSSSGGFPKLLDIFLTSADFPYSVWFKPLNTFTHLLSSIFIQLMYVRYINDPNLKQVTPKT